MERLKIFPALAQRALFAGALAFVQKPINVDELLGAVPSALHEEQPS